MKKQISKIVTALAVGTLFLTFSCKKPSASFTSDKTAVKIGEPVNFTNTSEADAKAMWDFGDGTQSMSNQNMISHAYAKAGTYNVTLTVAKKNGKKPSDAPAIVITVSEKGTNAMFTSKTAVSANEIVTFMSTSTEADELSWDFGDGYQNNLTQPVNPVQTHSYANNGSYIVTLTAFSNNRTVRSTYSSTITVTGASGDNVTQSMLVGFWKISSHVLTNTFNGSAVTCTANVNMPYSVTTFSTAAKIEVKNASLSGFGNITTYDGNGNVNSTGSYQVKNASQLTSWTHPLLKADASGTPIANSGVSNPVATSNPWTITTLNATTLVITFNYANSNAAGYNGGTCAYTANGINQVLTETVTYTKM